MVKDRFRETETYRNMEKVWEQICSKLTDEERYELEHTLVSEAQQKIEHEDFVRQHFDSFLRELDVGIMVKLQGRLDVEGLVLNVNQSFFEIEIVESSDEELIGKKMKVDEKIMSNFDICYCSF